MPLLLPSPVLDDSSLACNDPSIRIIFTTVKLLLLLPVPRCESRMTSARYMGTFTFTTGFNNSHKNVILSINVSILKSSKLKK